METDDENVFEDLSEALGNLFGTIDLNNRKEPKENSKTLSSRVPWRGRNSSSNDTIATDSTANSNLGSNWRSGDSRNASSSDSWRTKYSADESRKWKWNDRRNNETDNSDKNEGVSWRLNRSSGKNIEDNTSDNESSIRNLNKNVFKSQNVRSYQNRGRMHQRSTRRDTFDRYPVKSQINLSLREILDLEAEIPENVILALVDKLEAFKKVIGGSLSFEDTVLLLRVFERICSSHLHENRGKLIITIVNGKFLDKILEHLFLLATENAEDKNKKKFFWKDPERFWDNLLVLYENIFEFIPATACDLLPKIVKATILSINDAEKHQKIEVSVNIKEKLEKFQETLTSTIEKQNQSKNISEVEEPPDNFRYLNVYPSVKEITTRDVPFIRPIIKNGAYESVEHYLDVQFRLLKEDFTASLRNGICTYLERDEIQKPKQQFDVRIYEKVQFLAPHITQDRVAFLLKYTTKIDRRSIDESSKRFIYGSLLCFTSDNFVHIYFGTVVDNNIKYLKQGQIIVDVRYGTIDYNQKYTMVECTVFFEPYYQVLMALKKINEDNFPFKDYIIDVTSEIKPPEYIKETTIAYFMKERRHIFKILSPETWPKPDEVGLNESQFRAFQSALSQEFCIIQGPPGTGKTYTTLRIVEFLLRNKLCLNYDGPIFVICFTNHALDQFLEGILPFTNELLRVGGQSKCEWVEDYSLHKFREILRKLRRRQFLNECPSHVRRRYNTDVDEYIEGEEYFQDYTYSKYCTKTSGATYYYKLLEQLESYQTYLTDILSNEGIINFQRIANCLENDNIKGSWFGQHTNKEIIDWLMECGNAKFKSEVPKQVEQDSENDSEVYFQVNELYNDRKVIDNFDEIPEYLNDYSFTPFGYKFKNEVLEEEILKLASNNKLDDIKYQTYQKQQQRNIQKMNYLTWRLEQSKTQKVQEELNPNTPPEEMTPDERWNFYRYWLHLLEELIYEEISETDEHYRAAHRAFKEISEIGDLYIMKKMNVIGMTTTGAARHQTLLQKLKCPIVIAEEAAEVLESHILVSLSDECQHLILIGDHQQLRPNTAQFNLATKYNLEVSLFERMIQNGIHCQQLNIQHRMRPEIARLIVPAIYPKLDNHHSIENLPHIRGVTKNLFFINHSIDEDYVYNNSSHKNIYEAKYIIRLASYFIKQGYEADEITILTTYKGQMYLLLEEKQRYLNDLHGVRITVVDNFQGEENKIILLSLVRSNKEGNIGFLKTKNRVCVALSRAKEGFFIIGNMNNLEQQSSSVWPKVKNVLLEQDAIGIFLTLQCQIHSTKTYINTWEDFAKVPEGGCNIPCNTKLDCGHICKLMCHPYDRNHEEYKCQEKCTKSCVRGHPCLTPCYFKCTSCLIPVKTELSCGHVQSVPCHVKPEEFLCTFKVEAELSCGHTKKKRCHEKIEDVKCFHLCKEILKCGHACKLQCHVEFDPEHYTYICEEPCTKFKKGCTTSEHICVLKCSAECPPCTDIVRKRRSTCTHKVRVPCNEEIDGTDCKEKCRKMLPCGHYCPKLCSEECGNCSVMVTKTIEACGHSVTTECKNEVDRKMCNDDCSQFLKCGHLCKNKCNEPCTEECKIFVTYKDPETGTMVTNFCYMESKIIKTEINGNENIKTEIDSNE